MIRVAHTAPAPDLRTTSKAHSSVVGLSRVGTAAALPITTLAQYAGGLVDLDARPGALAKALAGCRRFNTPSARRVPTREIALDDALAKETVALEYEALSVVDRAEALVSLGSLVPSPWTRLMLNRGYSILGELIRDRAALASSIQLAINAPPRTIRPAMCRWLAISTALVDAPCAEEIAQHLLGHADSTAEGSRNLRVALLAQALRDPSALTANIQLRRHEQEQRSAIHDANHDAILRNAAARVKKVYVLSDAA
ncbi:MAG: hypothetical protein ABI229_07040 [Gemmatimonadaceae bacterium]